MRCIKISTDTETITVNPVKMAFQEKENALERNNVMGNKPNANNEIYDERSPLKDSGFG